MAALPDIVPLRFDSLRESEREKPGSDLTNFGRDVSVAAAGR